MFIEITLEFQNDSSRSFAWNDCLKGKASYSSHLQTIYFVREDEVVENGNNQFMHTEENLKFYQVNWQRKEQKCFYPRYGALKWIWRRVSDRVELSVK